MKYPNLFISIKKLTNFALPISMSLFVSMISGFFAMLIVAQLGKLELAAGALAISTYLPVMMVASTIFYQASHYAHEKFWPSCPQNLFASRDLY